MLLLLWQYMLYLAPDDLDLKSSLEGGGPRSGGGCLFQRRASRVREIVEVLAFS